MTASSKGRAGVRASAAHPCGCEAAPASRPRDGDGGGGGGIRRGWGARRRRGGANLAAEATAVAAGVAMPRVMATTA